MTLFHIYSIHKETIPLYSTAIRLIFLICSYCQPTEAEAETRSSHLGTQSFIRVLKANTRQSKGGSSPDKTSRSSRREVTPPGRPKYRFSYDFPLQEVLVKNTFPSTRVIESNYIFLDTTNRSGFFSSISRKFYTSGKNSSEEQELARSCSAPTGHVSFNFLHFYDTFLCCYSRHSIKHLVTQEP